MKKSPKIALSRNNMVKPNTETTHTPKTPLKARASAQAIAIAPESKNQANAN
jgi:hypothetical protein